MRYQGCPDDQLGPFAAYAAPHRVFEAVCHTAPPPEFEAHDWLTGVVAGGRYRVEVRRWVPKNGRPFDTLRVCVGEAKFILGREQFARWFQEV